MNRRYRIQTRRLVLQIVGRTWCEPALAFEDLEALYTVVRRPIEAGVQVVLSSPPSRAEIPYCVLPVNYASCGLMRGSDAYCEGKRLVLLSFAR